MANVPSGTAHRGCPGQIPESNKMVVCVLSVDGDADAAVENRIRIGWNNFRQLVPLLTNIISISLTVRGRLYSSCV